MGGEWAYYAGENLKYFTMGSSTEVSVLHDFEFPTYCNGLELSPDGETLLAIGGYKPVVSLFDLKEHSLKLERNSEDELLKGVFLGDDWTKLVLLQNSGRLEFHSQFGKHKVVNLMDQCRDIKADKINAVVLAGSKKGEIYRFSLAEGRFLSSISTSVANGEEIAINRANTVYAIVGGNSTDPSVDSGGMCEFIDSRCNKAITSFKINSSATSCTFSDNGLNFAVGTEAGTISVYDMRSSSPLITKDHNYDFRIKSVKIKNNSVMSLDKRGVKVWDKSSGKILTAIQPTFDANAFTVSDGILFLGGSTSEMKTYYVPSIGAIPKWCSSLEGATEEMDELQKMTYYDHYRFISEEDLTELNLQKEVGKLIRPHMHGYLIPHTLYNKHSRK